MNGITISHTIQSKEDIIMYNINMKEILEVRAAIKLYGKEYYMEHCFHSDQGIDYGPVSSNEAKQSIASANVEVLRYGDLIVKITVLKYKVLRAVPKTMVIELLPVTERLDVGIRGASIGKPPEILFGEGMGIVLTELVSEHDDRLMLPDPVREAVYWKIVDIGGTYLNLVGIPSRFGERYDRIESDPLTINDGYADFSTIHLDIKDFPLELAPERR